MYIMCVLLDLLMKVAEHHIPKLEHLQCDPIALYICTNSTHTQDKLAHLAIFCGFSKELK